MMYLSGQHFSQGLNGTHFKPILGEVTKLGAKNSMTYQQIAQMQAGRSAVTKSRGGKQVVNTMVSPQTVSIPAQAILRTSGVCQPSLEAQARDAGIMLS